MAGMIVVYGAAGCFICSKSFSHNHLEISNLLFIVCQYFTGLRLEITQRDLTVNERKKVNAFLPRMLLL